MHSVFLSKGCALVAHRLNFASAPAFVDKVPHTHATPYAHTVVICPSKDSLNDLKKDLKTTHALSFPRYAFWPHSAGEIL